MERPRTRNTLVRAALAAAVIMPPSLLVSCMPGHVIMRDIIPSESAETATTRGGAALVRSIYCDVTAAPVDGDMWASLRSYGSFARKPAPCIRQRVPPVTAFLVVVKSTINAPLTLKGARLVCGESGRGALTAERLARMLRSPAYAGIDVRGLLSPRRIIREVGEAETTDLDRDTIELKLDFVPPRDAVTRVIAFEKVPAEARAITLRLTIGALATEKTLDINFVKREYRAADGEHGRGGTGEKSGYGK